MSHRESDPLTGGYCRDKVRVFSLPGMIEGLVKSYQRRGEPEIQVVGEMFHLGRSAVHARARVNRSTTSWSQKILTTGPVKRQ